MHVLASLVLLATLALAAPSRGAFYLEGPAVGSRSEAVVVVREATSRGWNARVVKRYDHGDGWEFVARVEGFEDQEGASAAARELADATGVGVAVYASEGDEVRVIENVAGTPANAVGEAAAVSPDALTVAQWMERAARAHGGVDGGQAVIEAADEVLFRFRRRVPGGPVVDHTWARRGADLYVQVDVVEGEAVPSRTWLLGDRAWLVAGDAPPAPQDPTRARAALDRFSPEQTLGFPLRFARAVASRPELQLLHRDGTVRIEGERFEHLRYDGERGAGAVALAIDPKRFLVRQVELGTDVEPVVHRFADYRDLGSGLVVPWQVRTWHGEELADEIEVLQLEVDPLFPEEWFTAPEAPGGEP